MSLLSQLDRHLSTRPGEPVPAALRAAWRQALDAVANGASLDSALLNGGRRTRDSALGRAAELLAPTHGSWTAARLVLAALVRYQDAHRPPRGDVEDVLQAVIDAGPVPTSTQTIWVVLRNQRRD